LIVFIFRLNELKEKRIPDQKYFEDMTDEIPEIKNKIEILKKNVPELADCFQFYQDLRGYVTDLVECLDEKVGEFSSYSDVISIIRLIKELLLKK
jgi:archaellum component FlaC